VHAIAMAVEVGLADQAQVQSIGVWVHSWIDVCHGSTPTT
jgi:hypothetical protein